MGDDPRSTVDIEKVAVAIRIIESRGVPNAIGDHGLALGPYQFHPDAFWDWCEKPPAGASWSDWFHLTICKFLGALADAYPDMKEDEMAVVFHQHCYVRRASAQDWVADNYAINFRKAFGSVS